MLQIVPHRVTQSSIEVWLGVFYEAEPPYSSTLTLISPGRTKVTRPIHFGAWQTLYGDGRDPIHYCRLTLSDLSSASQYELLLVGEDGKILARGSAETLPQRLPDSETGGGPERPLTLWLSSCFYAPRAPSGLEEMVRSVVRDARMRPHIKILAGDQVYLDFPQSKTIFFAQERLRQHFNDVYASAWTHPAFSELLSHGGNVFIADDHELWDNYPESPVPVLWPLRGAAFRKAWEALARERCEAIQSVEPLQRVDIGAPGALELVIISAQTRLERTRDLRRIMSEESMARLVEWIDNLTCPAVLALSQPVFTYSGEGTWNISDYRQYREKLQPALHKSPQDIVVLAGDPHFGRIGVARFGANDERQLVEVVSSPLTLVTPLVGRERIQKPPTFPHYGPLHLRRQVEYPKFVESYESGDRRISEEHAMLLRFSRLDDTRLRLRVLLRLARQETPALEWSWETTLRSATRHS
jgi:hypothetical protein